jgi:hypothetical protein
MAGDTVLLGRRTRQQVRGVGQGWNRVVAAGLRCPAARAAAAPDAPDPAPPCPSALQAGAASAPRVLAVYSYGSAVFFNSDEEVRGWGCVQGAATEAIPRGGRAPGCSEKTTGP